MVSEINSYLDLRSSIPGSSNLVLVICEMALLCYYSLGVVTILPAVLVMSLMSLPV